MLEITKNVTMNNIPLSSLPHFKGMTSKDSNSFLLESDTLCISNNDTDNSKKLKLFPATLKKLYINMVHESRETHYYILG